MAHHLPDAKIRKMPTLVLKAIRKGRFLTLTDDMVTQVQVLSRIVNRAAEAGHDVLPLMTAYSSFVDACMPRLDPDKPWTEEMTQIHNMVWPFMQSAYSMRCQFYVDYGVPKSIVHLTEIVNKWVAEREAEAHVDPAQADADIRAEMVRVCNLYPRLGLSFGYIGNLWTGPSRDDRSFMVFTQVKYPNDLVTFQFGHHDYCDLPKLRTKVMSNLERWARELDEKLTAGTVVLRSTAHLEAVRKAA